jgi:hypothetical protein
MGIALPMLIACLAMFLIGSSFSGAGAKSDDEVPVLKAGKSSAT